MKFWLNKYHSDTCFSSTKFIATLFSVICVQKKTLIGQEAHHGKVLVSAFLMSL